MLLLYLILNSISASLLQDLSTLYENLRYQTQYFITQTPKNMIDSTFGFKSQILDFQDLQIDEDEDENQDYDFAQISNIDFNQEQLKRRRILDQDAIPQYTPTFVDEYYKQGPLSPVYCGFGQSILLNATQHYCSQKRVSKLQYESETNKSSCEIRYRLTYGCLCPPDFSGSQCLKWNLIICKINQPSQDCYNLADEDYYNQNIDGNPPCFKVEQEKQVENLRVVCSNYDQSLLHPTVQTYEDSFEVVWSNYSRGISALSLSLYNFSLPNPQDPNDPSFYIQYALPEEEEKKIYKYDHQPLYFDTANLKSSFQFTIQPYITYINWTNLHASKTISINQILNSDQLQGYDYISFTYDTGNMSSHFGRYSLEIGLNITVNNFYSIQKYINQPDLPNDLVYKPQFEPKILFFEDLSYKEPVFEDSSNILLFIISVSIILLIFIAVFISFKFRYILFSFQQKKVDNEQYEQTESPSNIKNSQEIDKQKLQNQSL